MLWEGDEAMTLPLWLFVNMLAGEHKTDGVIMYAGVLKSVTVPIKQRIIAAVESLTRVFIYIFILQIQDVISLFITIGFVGAYFKHIRPSIFSVTHRSFHRLIAVSQVS